MEKVFSNIILRPFQKELRIDNLIAALSKPPGKRTAVHL